MKNYLLFLLCLVCNIAFPQENERPKIGLTLSGGGAKGLAHIGLLQAIDSAGVKVDYVTGTSMGAIVGGLYAVGYSGQEIEDIARKIDWDKILTNRSPYDLLILPKKNKMGKYLEIPLIDGKVSFRKGALESNELWLTLNELFFPYLTTADFSKFQKGFRCVAADIENGDAVVLKNGNIVKAIRASMAIPVAFTPVEIDEKTLIDGGIAMNFPVSEVKDMGADFVIGSSVSGILLQRKDIDNPFQMISQLAFYKENKDFQQQVKSTDIFVDYPIEKYNASSFSSSNEIISLGIKRGKEIYPQLKRFKDSLDAIYGKEPVHIEKRKMTNELFVSKVHANGLSKREADFFMNMMDFQDNKSYTSDVFSDKIREVFGSGNFRKINYEFIPNNESDRVTVNINFEKEPQNLIKTGLSYNSERGIALILGYRVLGCSNPFSETSAEIAIGENPQFNIRNHYFFNSKRNWYLESTVKGEYTDISVYNENLKKSGLYNQKHFSFEVKANKLITGNFTAGIGSRYEYLKYSPEIETFPKVYGKINFLTGFVDLHFNNLNSPSYPNSGNIIDFEAGVNYNQHPDFKYDDGNSATPQSSPLFSKKAYYSIKYYSAHYLPVNKHSLFFKLHSGMHFGNKQPFLNDFIVGGNDLVIRNQILFPGFRTNSIFSSSVIAPQVGLHYSVTKKLVVTATSSFLKYDFIKSNIIIDENHGNSSVWGVALAAGYRSFIGPLEAIFMYNDINNNISPSFNIGYSLNF
ncbi:patatin-like phospholipase family protein [Gelidibacter japonicus]|uniref:patatin-like phospholipase family protein n=1 Tax=Gelidibacter japonicus TaxID=1962232 RepID=UPI003A8E22B5